MKDVLTYKGFIGSVHFSAVDKVFHGRIEGIDDLVTFEGRSVDELLEAFHGEVDDYTKLCKEHGKETMRSYKGGFNVRVTPEIHRRAVETAIKKGMSLNQLVQKAIEKELVYKE
ncbi:MAG: DNA repair protein [Planctomycetes bacterium RIFCSPLOWO2_12_FULL_39_13]|nr:MAG: DNA repair protein [Planctomycetes bacterium GWA2_39_15]OHB43179.1 MAG: DNA repair protein [Planctomycetes bacterium GWC2_39_26]OHC00098.1 MAG: DNA repair protein [Planctomycetes bacterium RIFCSPLOWO2_12_FULL_39_13]